jgi:hypothetical protein
MDLWNLTANTTPPVLDYIVMSAAKPEQEPELMVTTRLSRTPDDALDGKTGSERLVPAAEKSILSIPFDSPAAGWPTATSRTGLASALLHDLAADQASWQTASLMIDGQPHQFKVLVWTKGALWVGLYKDISVSIIGRDVYAGNEPELRTMTSGELDGLTEKTSPSH